MTSILENVINEVAKEAPNAPVAQLAEAAVNTVVSPTPESILADIETIFSIVKEVKAKLAGVHPSVAAIFKALI